MFKCVKEWLRYGVLLLGVSTFAVSAQANVPPHQMLEEVTQRLITTLKSEQAAIEQQHEYLYELVERVLLPHVDLDVMSRYVLGKYWRNASATQRQRFSHEFKNLMVRFYVSALLDDPQQLGELLANSDNLIRYLPAEIDESTNKTRVRAEVHMPNGGPRVPVSFNLFLKEGHWLIYDVNVDGISLVSNYRSSFATEMRGGGIDKLIENLAVRNEELLQATRDRQAQARQPE
ncbi:MAG: ABC transporter substrate-binding protein [Gammaproteobacteria bacterium]|nr:ABC transporter substrate-binding protein [Gammaproteobacteria bacterium]